MTKEQFEKGYDAIHSLRDAEDYIKQVVDTTPEELLVIRMPYHFGTNKDLSHEVKEIILKHAAKIKQEIIACANLHIAKLQKEFEQI